MERDWEALRREVAELEDATSRFDQIYDLGFWTKQPLWRAVLRAFALPMAVALVAVVAGVIIFAASLVVSGAKAAAIQAGLLVGPVLFMLLGFAAVREARKASLPASAALAVTAGALVLILTVVYPALMGLGQAYREQVDKDPMRFHRAVVFAADTRLAPDWVGVGNSGFRSPTLHLLVSGGDSYFVISEDDPNTVLSIPRERIRLVQFRRDGDGEGTAMAATPTFAP